ncbi:MAG: diaminopimelate decarboxylase, partial [Parvularculaceae bacterium]|nr:diaminopimelate decarboxylase [Parvularculaceae bacterium]
AMVRRVVEPLGVELILEPGRMIVGNAGVLVATTLYVKEGEARRFLIVDAAMNDLMRPALYDARHEIWPLAAATTDAGVSYDVVGPVCESTDIFARGAVVPTLAAGDRVALMSAGAYGAVLSNQYNARLLVPEVLVSGARFAVIRRRPTFDEMIALEAPAPWLMKT